jgi:hypothetical protein
MKALRLNLSGREHYYLISKQLAGAFTEQSAEKGAVRK